MSFRPIHAPGHCPTCDVQWDAQRPAPIRRPLTAPRRYFEQRMSERFAT